MLNRHGSPAALLSLIALLGACSSDPTAPATPASVARLAVAPSDLALSVGGSEIVVANPLDASGAVLRGYTISWTSSDTVIATVTPDGQVRGRTAGTATIRATAGGRTGSVQVRVGQTAPEAPAVAWIQIVPSGTLPQAPGTSRQLSVVARAQNGTEITGRPVTWASSDSAVATVTATGLLAVHATGTARITAVVDGKRDSVTVSVSSLIARIETDPTVLSLGVGDARTVTATARDVHGVALSRAFVWSTTNSAVARVDASGRVLATGAGTALITVSSEGRQATVQVVVTGTMWQLAQAGGQPLPTVLFTTTSTINGNVHETSFQLTGATLRMRDGRYELRLQGWTLSAHEPPVATTLASDGVFAYDIWTGMPVFIEGTEWQDAEPRFRSRITEDGRLELGWSRAPGAPVIPLLFVP